MENTTKISDLPENIHFQPTADSNPSNFPNSNGNNYIPINIHPNPYGNQSGHSNGIITPSVQPQNRQLYDTSQEHYRLPSKDIRVQQTEYTQDDEIRANYIPKARNVKDYLKEYENSDNEEEEESRKINKHKKNKKKVRFTDDLFLQLQTPVLVGIIYFIFQMGVFNRILQKITENFIKLFNADGSIGLYGNLTKSVLFGMVFFVIVKADKIFES
jgi:hypothetical protein